MQLITLVDAVTLDPGNHSYDLNLPDTPGYTSCTLYLQTEGGLTAASTVLKTEDGAALGPSSAFKSTTATHGNATPNLAPKITVNFTLSGGEGEQVSLYAVLLRS